MSKTLAELLKEEIVEKAIIDCICTEIAKSMRQTVIEVDEALWELMKGKCQTDHGISVIETVIRTKATRAYSRWQDSKASKIGSYGFMMVITLKPNESSVSFRRMTSLEYALNCMNPILGDNQDDGFKKYISMLDAEINDGIKN